MIRDLRRLADNVYDVVVIGGGINGACIAWDAALRGLSVALVEKADFASATSANSLKIIHGGFRYLRNADFRRMRESICERRTLMRIAPHLIHPIPVLIPFYGQGTQRKGILSLALAVNDLVSFDRNHLGDPQKHIPNGRIISNREVLELFPDVKLAGLKGGMLFYDAQVYNSERLVLSFLKSAVNAGAQVANYVEVTGFLVSGQSITGVRVKDGLTNSEFEVQGRAMVNAAGPWVGAVQRLLGACAKSGTQTMAKAINLITRPLPHKCIVGIPAEPRCNDSDASVSTGEGFLFAAPWRGHSLIGTAYSSYSGESDDFRVTEQDVLSLLRQINQSWPCAELTLNDVRLVHAGLLPGSQAHTKSADIQLNRNYQIRDLRHEGFSGLISVEGVKYTTARKVGEKAVDQVFAMWGQKPPKSSTSVVPLQGGDIEDFDAFSKKVGTQLKTAIKGSAKKATIDRLLLNYGTSCREIIEGLNQESDNPASVDTNLAVWQAETRHGVRQEMAQKLVDIVFRRTEMGSAGRPDKNVLLTCAEVLAGELGWNSERVRQELREVDKNYALMDTIR